MDDSKNSNLPSQTEAWDALNRLALDLSWSWNHSADEVWKRLDPELWELTANPWLILESMSPRKLDALKIEIQADAAFRQRIEQLLSRLNEKNAAPAWFQTAHPSSPLRTVAYFSMEYMLSEALPIYSGGLGNVAGDQLKAASDLGVPVVAIGLLYQQGYFRQELDAHGDQQVLYPVNEPDSYPFDGFAHRMASCSEWRCRYRAARSGFGRGRFRWDEPGCTCWTRTIRPIRRVSELLPASYTAAGPNCACSRRCCSESRGGSFCARLASRGCLPPERRPRRFRRAGEGSLAYGGDGLPLSVRRSPLRAPGTSLPRIRRSMRDLTGSPPN